MPVVEKRQKGRFVEGPSSKDVDGPGVPLSGAQLIHAPVLVLNLNYVPLNICNVRRAVILVVATTSCGLACIGALVPATSVVLLIVNLVFGAFVFPLYGQFVALANDWVPAEKRVAAASTLVLASSFGAMAAPMTIGLAVQAFGPSAYFWSLATCLAVLALYLSYRVRVRQAVPVERQSTFQPILARSGRSPTRSASGSSIR